MNRTFAHLSLIFSGMALAVQPSISQSLAEADRIALAYTQAHYTKYEYQIPMRDGVRLFAAV